MRKPLPRPDKSFVAVPNEYFNGWMKEVNPAETVILNFILRKTIGYGKQEDWISLSQFEEGTPLSKPTIILHLKNLIDKEMIFRREEGTVESGNQRVFYRLNMESNYDTCKEFLQEGVKNPPKRGKESLHTIYNIQKTNISTELQTNSSLQDKPSVNYIKILFLYADFYREVTGCAYTANKKRDLGMLKRINKTGIVAELQGWRKYFETATQWIKIQGWIIDKTPTLNLLSSTDNINKIRVYIKKDYTRGL